MNLLLLDQKISVRDLLIRKLFPLGINVYHVDTPEAADKLMGTVKINAMLVDIDWSPEAGLKYLVMQSHLPIKPVRIVTSAITDRAVITKLVDTGIAGYLIKPFTEEKSLVKLVDILKNLTEADEQRAFYRVSPGPSDDKKTFFRLPSTSRLVGGTLLNISAGGLAINCAESVEDEELPIGSFVPKVQLKLAGQDLYLCGDVIYKKGSVFAIRLRECAERDLYTLSRFIFDKISETI